MSFITLYHHSLIQYLRFLCFKENAHKYCSCKLLKLFSLRKGGVSINVIIAISLEFGEMGTNMNLIQVMSKWSWIYFFFVEKMYACVCDCCRTVNIFTRVQVVLTEMQLLNI